MRKRNLEYFSFSYSNAKKLWGTERSGLNMNSEELHGKPLFIGVSEG